jgi:hypothetical protein
MIPERPQQRDLQKFSVPLHFWPGVPDSTALPYLLDQPHYLNVLLLGISKASKTSPLVHNVKETHRI